MRKLLLVLFTFYSILSNAQQITWSGMVDFEIRKGGANSNLLLNQTPNNNWSLFIPNARIITTVELNNKWWLNSTLQSDYYGQKKMNDVFFSLLNINYQPFKKNNLTFQAGRIIIPFGYNQNTFVAFENPFANLSLESSWNLRVDKSIGYIPSGALSYETNPGQSIIYQRRYTQGLSVFGTLGKDRILEYNLAVTSAPISGFSELSQGGNPSVIGRLVFQPIIWAKIGASYTHGGYMIREKAKNAVLTDNALASFNQTAYEFDLTLSYSYFEITGQYLINEWNAPYIYTPTGSTSLDYISINRLAATHQLVQAKANLPFLVGSYLAVRYENMSFNELTFPFLGINDKTPWTAATNRYEIAFGYKINKNIKTKISWLDGRNKKGDRDDFVFTTQVCVSF